MSEQTPPSQYPPQETPPQRPGIFIALRGVVVSLIGLAVVFVVSLLFIAFFERVFHAPTFVGILGLFAVIALYTGIRAWWKTTR